MTPVAIFFMILAMLIIWGGLVVAVRFLMTHPLDEQSASTTAGHPGDTPSGDPGSPGRR